MFTFSREKDAGLSTWVNKKSALWPIYGTKSACLQNKKDRPPKWTIK